MTSEELAQLFVPALPVDEDGFTTREVKPNGLNVAVVPLIGGRARITTSVHEGWYGYEHGY
jgi:hypothetical protein